MLKKWDIHGHPRCPSFKALVNTSLRTDRVCVYLFFIAETFDNLALRVFRRYHAELSRTLRDSPDEVAAELYSAELITMEDKSQALDTPGLNLFRKVDSLMEAVERGIITENSTAPLRKFCHVFQRRYGIDSILARMKLRLGEWEK